MESAQRRKLTYSVPEMAAVLGIGKQKAYELTRRADFPKIRVGKKIIVPIREFETWVSDHAFDDVEDWTEEGVSVE